jgi:hypothetical protein
MLFVCSAIFDEEIQRILDGRLTADTQKTKTKAPKNATMRKILVCT